MAHKGVKQTRRQEGSADLTHYCYQDPSPSNGGRKFARSKSPHNAILQRVEVQSGDDASTQDMICGYPVAETMTYKLRL